MDPLTFQCFVFRINQFGELMLIKVNRIRAVSLVIAPVWSGHGHTY